MSTKPPRDEPLFLLSRCEQQVLDLLLTGKTTQEAADALFVSKRTVEFHVRHIYAKMECRNRVELTIRAMNSDLHPLFSCTGEAEGAQV